MLARIVQLLLIVTCFDAVLNQAYASESTQDHYSPQSRHGDGKNTELVTQQLIENDSCSDLWFTLRNGTCHCGSTLHDVVTCNEHTKEVMVLDCYCMTTDSTNQSVVGKCFYNCMNLSQNAQYYDPIYHEAPSDCSHLHRRGTLCGQCEIDHFPLAYSYDMECIKCTHPDSWWMYFAVAFLPLTIFIAIIFIFRISVVSPKLHAFVTFAQIFAVPMNVRIFLLSTKSIHPLITALLRIYMAVYGIWNLDFFRTLIPGICLHLTTLEVLALDYLIAVYPMILMIIAYTLVELHGHGFRPILFMWRPFHYLFVRFRREWDIQTSIVDTFVTFFILSTTKFFSVSFNLLIPTSLYNVSGDTIGVYSYYNPNLEYMKGEHLPYALLAVTVFGLCLVLPLILLVFSSFRCVRNCFLPCRVRVVEEFLKAFQQYYKDGTDGTMDCRWYAAYYILVNLCVYILDSVTLSGIFYLLATIYFTVLAAIVLLVEPYREEYAFFNLVDCVQYLWLALLCSSIVSLNISGLLQRRHMVLAYSVSTGVATAPLIYITALIIHRVGKRSGLKFCNKHRRERVLNGSLPDRLYNPNHYRDSCGYVPSNSQLQHYQNRKV